jgi:hypothetical protein
MDASSRSISNQCRVMMAQRDRARICCVIVAATAVSLWRRQRPGQQAADLTAHFFRAGIEHRYLPRGPRGAKTIADDEGSSRRIRRQFPVLPGHDVGGGSVRGRRT